MRHFLQPAALALAVLSAGALADGSSIDKVYDPYVQPLEKEIEYRLLHETDDNDQVDGRTYHKLAYGQAIAERLFVEAYVVASDGPDSDFDVSAYELELKWQLSDQGEYANDWGLMFELERESEYDEPVWEAATTLIALHEWGRWVGTANLSLIYEWGEAIDNELETALSAQLRYRYKRHLEPALELFQSDMTTGLGPQLLGEYRFGVGRKLIWEFGPVFGLKDDTPDITWKVNLEYEFF